MRVDLVLAPNPGPMTGPGTNTWIVSDGGEAVIVDPGPMIPEHLDALVDAVADLRAVAILVTHTHSDHAPAANPLGARLGVPVIGPDSGPDFSPERRIADGEGVVVGNRTIVALATPGHTSDSTCYLVDGALFTGDHIMGGSTVMVEDMGAYMTSLQRVLDTAPRVIHPGHGPVIDDPAAVVAHYLAHRRERESQILAAVASGASTVAAVVERVYAGVDRSLHPAAAVSVDAHLRKLADEGRVRYPGGGRDATVETLP